MKTNLKNFPKSIQGEGEDVVHRFADFAIKVAKWKNNFEKELCEIRNSDKNLCLDEGHDLIPDLIREILGE